jgi:hypothetical protein
MREERSHYFVARSRLLSQACRFGRRVRRSKQASRGEKLARPPAAVASREISEFQGRYRVRTLHENETCDHPGMIARR